MLRKIIIFTILLLVVFTTLIKNHTKKLDEKIFSVKENINYLNSIKEMVQLEYDYLSSPEKLVELYNLYFDGELKYTLKKNIIVINSIEQLNPEISYRDE